MNPNAPHRKVIAGGLANALSFLIVWAANKYAGAGIDAETALAVNTVVLFIIQYAVPNAPGVSDAA